MAKKTLPENKTGRGGGQYNNKNAEKWTEEKALKLGKELIEWMSPKFIIEEYYDKQGELKEKIKDIHSLNIYWQEFVYIKKSIDPDIFSYLNKKFRSFSELKKKADLIQESKLTKYATHNKINPVFSMFILKAKHGLKDRVDITSDDEKVTNVTLNVVNSKDNIDTEEQNNNKVDE